MARDQSDQKKLVARNKKAHWKYEILDRLEAGIALLGSEVKSLRSGRVALVDSYARFKNHELFLVHCHISPYEMAGRENHEPMRERKLLLKKRELRRLRSKVEERGLTIVPLTIYFLHGLAKVEIGLARGKARHDKREDLKKRDADREMRRAGR